jgi:hypothetical protein
VRRSYGRRRLGGVVVGCVHRCVLRPGSRLPIVRSDGVAAWRGSGRRGGGGEHGMLMIRLRWQVAPAWGLPGAHVTQPAFARRLVSRATLQE